MLISIIHRVNRAQSLNLDPPDSLGADKGADGERAVLGWGCSLGLQDSGRGGGEQEPLAPPLGLLGCISHDRKPVGLGREESGKAESAAQGMLSGREGEPTCAERPLGARPGAQAVRGTPARPGSSCLHPGCTLTSRLSHHVWAPVSSCVTGIVMSTLQSCCED